MVATTSLIARYKPQFFAIILVIFLVCQTISVPTVLLTPQQEIPPTPASKIDPRLANVTSSTDTVDVLVKYDGPLGELKTRAAIRMIDSSAEIIETFAELNILRTKLIARTIPKLARKDFVLRIWSNEIDRIPSSPLDQMVYASSPRVNSQLIDLIGARELWDAGYNGSGVVIAILDTGIDFLHPDLDDFDDNSSTYDAKVTAYASFVEGDTLPVDIIGHGTYVASIVAGTGNKSNGLYSGIAPGATLLSAKVTLGGLFAAPSWIVSGIEWACSRGADIILLPFNTFGAPGDAVSEAVRVATEKGVLVIAAAGDDGPDYFTIMSPGGSREALTIGAFDSFSNQVPSFSGRGPTFEMFAKPDLLAPGVGIVGARAGAGFASAGFGDFNLENLGELSSLLGGSFGELVNDYYIQADSTAASAAIVTGAAAILLQAFDRASPIVLSNVLRDTATPLPYGANDAGAGLLNLPAAFAQLQRLQSPGESHVRTTGIPLLATGIITADSASASTILLMSSFGTMVAAFDQRDTANSTHLLMGMFSVRWNNMEPTNLMMFEVKRELHQVHTSSQFDNYNRYISILSSNDTVYIILLVESYNLTLTTSQPFVGIKVTPFILNLGEEEIYNVSLYLAFSCDLFLDGLDDHGKYALNNQELFVYSQSEDYQDFYFGLNASRSLSAFEIGNASKVRDHIANDSLTGSTSFDGSVGLGMKWDFGVVSPNEPVNVTLVMGFAENRTFLDASIEYLWQLSPSLSMQQQGDLVVVEADIPRIAKAGEYYTSETIVMNIGVDTSPLVAALIIGQANGTDEGNLYTQFFRFENIRPFQAVRLKIEWSPEREGIFSAAWVTAVSIASAISLFSNPLASLATTGVSLLDDFLIRDLFVITPLPSISVFPKEVPFAPFDIRFPMDFGMYSFILASTVPLGNLTVIKYGNATDWGNVTLTPSESVEGYYNFSLLLFVPTFAMDGYHECDYVLHSETGWTSNITFRISLTYPLSTLFFDASHGGGFSAFGGGSIGQISSVNTSSVGGGLSFPLAEAETSSSSSSESLDIESLSELEDLLEAFRLTTFSGLSEFKRQLGNRRIDLIEIPGQGVSSDLLMLFSGIVIIRPTTPFNSTEINTIRDFSADGGKLLIFGDTPERANLTVLNELLRYYGYEMNGSHSVENTTEIVSSSLLGKGVDAVWLGGGTFIRHNQSNAQVLLGGRPVVTLDLSRPELALFGSSRIFMNRYLPNCNNSILLDNLIEYLLLNTLSCQASLAENTTYYPVGQSVFLNLRVNDYYGNPVNDLTVIIVFELPNGSLAFFFAGFVENGLYTSQFASSYWHDEGRINGIFMVLKSKDYSGTFASISFWFYKIPVTNSTPTNGSLLSMPEVAALSAISVFGSVLVVLFWNRQRRKRRLRVPEIDTTLVQDIDNSLNMLLAAFIQIEDIIREEELDRIQKVEMIRSILGILEKALEEFADVSRRVGGV